jgi:hypothetical protein
MPYLTLVLSGFSLYPASISQTRVTAVIIAVGRAIAYLLFRKSWRAGLPCQHLRSRDLSWITQRVIHSLPKPKLFSALRATPPPAIIKILSLHQFDVAQQV